MVREEAEIARGINKFAIQLGAIFWFVLVVFGLFGLAVVAALPWWMSALVLATGLVIGVLTWLPRWLLRGNNPGFSTGKALIAHVEERLKKYRYAAIGEFHVYGADADLPVMRRMVQLAKQHGLWLHLHGDSDAVERVIRQDPDARVLWAHSGFDRPEAVRAMLKKHPRLHADLAFRNDHASGGKIDPAWREAFLEFPDRFLVGTDTFTPER